MNRLLPSSITFSCFWGFGSSSIFISSFFSIWISGLLIPSINNLSHTLHSNGSFSLGSINIVSFNSIIFSCFGGLDSSTIFISSFFSIWVSGLLTPSINKVSHTLYSKGSFCWDSINIWSFNSILFSSLGLAVLKISNLSPFWISLSFLSIPSIKILSTNSFFNASFSLGGIKILLICSILFWGLGLIVPNISNLFKVWILFSGFSISSIFKSSIHSINNSSFSFGGINNFSRDSILFSHFWKVPANWIASFVWILFSGNGWLPIKIESTDSLFKGTFCLGSIKMFSFCSIIFFVLGFSVLNISNLSIFWISLFCIGFPSILILSTFIFCNGSFSTFLGNISIYIFWSIMFLFFFDFLIICISSNFWTALSGLWVFSMNNLSIDCFT